MMPECKNDTVEHRNYPASRWLSVILKKDESGYYCNRCECDVLHNTDYSWGQIVAMSVVK